MHFPWIWLTDRVHSFCHETKHGGGTSFADNVSFLARHCFLVFNLFSAVCKLKSGSPIPVLTRISLQLLSIYWITDNCNLLNRTKLHLSHFFVLHQNIFVPYILLYIACLSLFHTETLFSPLKYIQLFQTKKGSFFFHRHTCIQWLHSFSLYNTFVYTCSYIVFPYIMHLSTLVTLFCCIIRNICLSK